MDCVTFDIPVNDTRIMNAHEASCDLANNRYNVLLGNFIFLRWHLVHSQQS